MSHSIYINSLDILQIHTPHLFIFIFIQARTMHNLILQCPICLLILQDPATLPCGHSFCLACIQKILHKNILKCPLDNKQHNLPNGIQSLSINFLLKELTQEMHIDRKYLGHNKLMEKIKQTFLDDSAQIAIKQIIEINTPRLQDRFTKAKNKLKNHRVYQKFHGTSKQAAFKIKQQGFKLPQKFERDDDKQGQLTFGIAVYLASYSSRVLQYTKEGCIVVSDVAVGKVKICANSQTNTTPQKAKQEGYDSFYFSKKKNFDLQKGDQTDQFAIFDPYQILPTHIVFLGIQNKYKNNAFHNMINNPLRQNINLKQLFQALMLGTKQQKNNTLNILGHLFRDYRQHFANEVISEYGQKYIKGLKKALKDKSEQTILFALRVIWNSTFNDQSTQYFYIQHFRCQQLLEFIYENHQSVCQRGTGMLINLTQLCKVNCMKFGQNIKQRFFKRLYQFHNGDIAKNETLRDGLGFLANVTKYYKEPYLKQLIIKYIEPLTQQINDKQSMQQALRIISNIIGYDDQWVRKGYVSAKGKQII